MSNQNMTPEDIIAAVADYANQGGYKKGGTTSQARRIIKALQLIGIERSDFRAQTTREWHRENGRKYVSYGDAMGSIRSYEGMARVIENAKLLNKCGISVHIIEGGSGRTSAFVSTNYPYRTVRINTETGEITQSCES